MLEVIKSNTWKNKSYCVMKRGMGGDIKQLVFTPQKAPNTFVVLLSMVSFAGLLIVPQYGGWVGCYLIWRFVFKKSRETVLIADLKKVDPLTEENETSMLAKTGWALAGGAVFGGAGLLAGALGKGNKHKAVAMLHFASDRRALVMGSKKDINALAMHCIPV